MDASAVRAHICVVRSVTQNKTKIGGDNNFNWAANRIGRQCASSSSAVKIHGRNKTQSVVFSPPPGYFILGVRAAHQTERERGGSHSRLLMACWR